MLPLHWDPSISLGSLLSVGAVILAVFKMNSNFAKMELKVETMWARYIRRTSATNHDGEDE